MKMRTLTTFSALALLAAASAAGADTVTLQSNYAGFIGLKHGLAGYDGSPESSLLVSFDGKGASTFIGAYNWTVVSDTDPNPTLSPGQSIYTYCIEKSQSFNVFNSYTFTTNENLSGNPLNGPDQGAITDLGALQLQSLVTNHWNQALSNNISAAAFALAVWEIEYDAGGRTGAGTDALDASAHSSDYYFANGRIQATATAGTTGSDALSLASSWLNQLTPADSLTSVLALNSSTNQDQITAVPLPAALPIGATLLFGLFSARKLRRRG
jgi:hypothetical protein